MIFIKKKFLTKFKIKEKTIKLNISKRKCSWIGLSFIEELCIQIVKVLYEGCHNETSKQNYCEIWCWQRWSSRMIISMRKWMSTTTTMLLKWCSYLAEYGNGRARSAIRSPGSMLHHILVQPAIWCVTQSPKLLELNLLNQMTFYRIFLSFCKCCAFRWKNIFVIFFWFFWDFLSRKWSVSNQNVTFGELFQIQ